MLSRHAKGIMAIAGMFLLFSSLVSLSGASENLWLAGFRDNAVGVIGSHARWSGRFAIFAALLLIASMFAFIGALKKKSAV